MYPSNKVLTVVAWDGGDPNISCWEETWLWGCDGIDEQEGPPPEAVDDDCCNIGPPPTKFAGFNIISPK